MEFRGYGNKAIYCENTESTDITGPADVPRTLWRMTLAAGVPRLATVGIGEDSACSIRSEVGGPVRSGGLEYVRDLAGARCGMAGLLMCTAMLASAGKWWLAWRRRGKVRRGRKAFGGEISVGGGRGVTRVSRRRPFGLSNSHKRVAPCGG